MLDMLAMNALIMTTILTYNTQSKKGLGPSELPSCTSIVEGSVFDRSLNMKPKCLKY